MTGQPSHGSAGPAHKQTNKQINSCVKVEAMHRLGAHRQFPDRRCLSRN